VAFPADVDIVAESEQEVELLGEEFVVELGVVAEERVGLDEGTAADDDLGAAVGDEVDGGELLEDADGVVGGEDGDGAGEADVLCACCDGGEEDCRGAGDVFFAVVFADGVDVEADAVGEFSLFEELGDALSGVAGEGVAGGDDALDEGIDSDLHGTKEDAREQHRDSGAARDRLAARGRG